MKAVCGDEIIGFAGWSFRSIQKGEEEAEERIEEKTEELVEERWSPWPPGANARFCEDAYLVGDAHMFKSVQGEPFASKSTLFPSALLYHPYKISTYSKLHLLARPGITFTYSPF